MKVQLIRHATLIVTMKGIRFLVDPMFSSAATMDPSPNTIPQLKNPLVDLPRNVSVNTFQTADAVLLTHTHRDHWDDAAVRILPTSMPIFCQPADIQKVLDAGFTNVTAVNESLTWNGIHITRTIAKHGVGEMADKMGPVSGYILNSRKEPTIYITGDTVWCEEVEDVCKQNRTDVIVAFAGGAEFTTGGPITMTVADVLSLTNSSPKSLIVAVHLDSWNHCALGRDDLRAYIDKYGDASKVLIPYDGETLEFSVRDFS